MFRMLPFHFALYVLMGSGSAPIDYGDYSFHVECHDFVPTAHGFETLIGFLCRGTGKSSGRTLSPGFLAKGQAKGKSLPEAKQNVFRGEGCHGITPPL